MPSSGLSRGVTWFKTDVSGLPISPIFKDQTVKPSSLTVWHLEDGTDRQYQNVGFKPTYAAW
jgi:hypothetical protein